MNPLDPFGQNEERWPDEPEEFDPDSLGPDVVDPSARVDPTANGDAADGDLIGADVDDELFRSFWGAVIFLNVAVAGLAIGAMLVYFRGDWGVGGAGLVVGAVAAIFAVRYYLKGRRHVSESARDADAPVGEGDAPEGDGR